MIAGIDDVSTLKPNLSLGELGLDSLMSLDIRQALQREADIVISLQAIRELTFAKLKSMVRDADAPSGNGNEPAAAASKPQQTLNGHIKAHYDLKQLMPTDAVRQLKAPTFHPKQAKPLFIVTPLEGTTRILKTLASKLQYEVYGLQCSGDVPLTSLEDMAAFYIQV